VLTPEQNRKALSLLAEIKLSTACSLIKCAAILARIRQWREARNELANTER
jgi:hypothetical protein